MLVTLDTNILYQALRSNSGAAYFILTQVRKRKIQISLSVPVFNEYHEVLTRETSLREFGLEITYIEKFLRFIAFVGKTYDVYYLLRPNLKDESDNKFMELAVTSQSDFLITSNVRDFQNSELIIEQLQIITPANFVKKWREKYG